MFIPDPAPTADPTRSDWRTYLVEERWNDWTPEQHGVWARLYARQIPYLRNRIVPAFLDGIERLHLESDAIPQLERLSDRLERLSGWRLACVRGIVPDEAFFAMLSERRFPIGNFIRSADNLDYLEEPDCFHDIFGHVPMLAHPELGRLMQSIGRLGIGAIAAGLGEEISRLYWHTVEFGLVRHEGGVRILGAGLASSFGEAHYSLEAELPRMDFTLEAAARTPYRNDRFQPHYFVSPSLGQVADALEGLDIAGLRRLAG